MRTECLVGVHGLGTGKPVAADQVIQCYHLVLQSRALICDSMFVGHDVSAERLEITVAQPTVILASGIDDQPDGLLGDCTNRVVDHLRALVGGAGIDEEDAAAGDTHSEIGIVAEVYPVAVCCRADQSVDVIGKLFCP